jgi:hypothetical protein
VGGHAGTDYGVSAARERRLGVRRLAAAFRAISVLLWKSGSKLPHSKARLRRAEKAVAG